MPQEKKPGHELILTALEEALSDYTHARNVLPKYILIGLMNVFLQMLLSVEIPETERANVIQRLYSLQNKSSVSRLTLDFHGASQTLLLDFPRMKL